MGDVIGKVQATLENPTIRKRAKLPDRAAADNQNMRTVALPGPYFEFARDSGKRGQRCDG
jgi:hypothetical protein